MFSGIGSVTCRMYDNRKEIFEGLRKNFLLGFNENIPAFIIAGLLHLIVFVMPFFTLIFSLLIFDPIIFFLSIACISFILILRLILALWYRNNPLFAFTHPIAVLWFQLLAIVKIRDYCSSSTIIWKGREV